MPRRKWNAIAVAAFAGPIAIAFLFAGGPAVAQNCKRAADVVTCDDGRTGRFTGDAIVWPDGTRSSKVSPHPSVIIGNKPSVRVGPGVFVGQGNGAMVPLDDPNSPNKTRCAVLDGVSYCH
jgi:hypothetical protein